MFMCSNPSKVFKKLQKINNLTCLDVLVKLFLCIFSVWPLKSRRIDNEECGYNEQALKFLHQELL
jgi:hypothetical protein